MEFNSVNALTAATQAQNLFSLEQVEGNRPPPPPPQDEMSDYMESSRDDEALRDFMHSIMAMEESGEFDAAELAANAPDSMKAFAEENGIDLESFFQQKHDQFQANVNRSSTPLPMLTSDEEAAQTYSETAQAGSAETTLFENLKASLQISTMA